MDKTRPKRTEEPIADDQRELRAVIETIPTMAWTASRDGSSTFVNRRWTEYTGLSLDETIGEGWLRALHPEDIERHVDAARRRHLNVRHCADLRRR